jgi:hypothetical protein
MNIFARELAKLLADHGKVLGSLYGLHSATHQLFPNKVTRLKRSLEQNITATLSAEELELVAGWLRWDLAGAEIRRLRAALVAESVRHLLGGRMNRDQALKLGEMTFQLLLDQEPEEFLTLREELLAGIRGGVPSEQHERGTLDVVLRGGSQSTDLEASEIEQALEPAGQPYEQGALWLEVARETSDPGLRLGYLAQACTLLALARDLATNAPTIASGTMQQQEWLSIMEAALDEAALLR